MRSLTTPTLDRRYTQYQFTTKLYRKKHFEFRIVYLFIYYRERNFIRPLHNCLFLYWENEDKYKVVKTVTLPTSPIILLVYKRSPLTSGCSTQLWVLHTQRTGLSWRPYVPLTLLHVKSNVSTMVVTNSLYLSSYP